MDLCTASLVFLLAIWFALSVVAQSSWRRRLLHADALQLLPLWNFFAPNPGIQDYYLLYRDEDQENKIHEWRLLQPTEWRRPISCIWNPGKLENKVISDLVQTLAGYQNAGSAIMVSLAYLVCLKMVTEAPRERAATLCQFVLAQKQGLDGSEELVPILVSEFHSLE